MTAARAHSLAAWAATLALLAWAALRVAPSQGGASRVTRLAVALVALSVAGAAATGALSLEPYELYARQPLFVKSARLGWLFERKLHASLAASALTVAALASAALERSRPGSTPAARRSASLEARARAVTTLLVTLAALAAIFATVAATLARA
jgi:hypothetical protein